MIFYITIWLDYKQDCGVVESFCDSNSDSDSSCLKFFDSNSDSRTPKKTTLTRDSDFRTSAKTTPTPEHLKK